MLLTEVYDKIRATVPTGSVVLFSGNDAVSKLIKKTTNSKWSHCGICLWLDLPSIDDSRFFLIESTTISKEPDYHGGYRSGCQMLPLRQKLYSFDGEAWLFPLKETLTDENQKAMTTWLTRMEGLKVHYSLWQAIAADYQQLKPTWFRDLFYPVLGWINTKEDLKRVFCSELVTEALKQGKILPPEINASLQLPSDVAKYSCFSDGIQLVNCEVLQDKK